MSLERVLRLAAGVLSVAGIAVAGYLTYVHVAAIEPFCVGGGGGCARVQASDQALLAGAPVAALGLATYLALLAATLTPGELARIAGALFALTGFGFSAYLTYQSVTAIGATCQWCLVSAGLMTVLAGLMVARLLVGYEDDA